VYGELSEANSTILLCALAKRERILPISKSTETFNWKQNLEVLLSVAGFGRTDSFFI
jgi:hypothetical protein